MTQILSRVLKTESIKWKELSFLQDDNFKEWVDDGNKKLHESILKYQFIDPFKVWLCGDKLYCLDGKHRWLDLNKALGDGLEIPELLPATFIDCTDIKEAAEMVLVYSSHYASITNEGFGQFIEKFSLELPSLQSTISLPTFDFIEFESWGKENSADIKEATFKTLNERFIIPPFSVFDTRQGYWQDRKKTWHSLGFDSQETREDVEIIAKSGQAPAIYALRNKMRESLGREPEWEEILQYAKKKGLHVYEGASIFDPVLTEICYKWFCPEKGKILDPFAGGSVRGIVAAVLGYDYLGIDLRKEQVESNVAQALGVFPFNGIVKWKDGDSNVVLEDVQEEYDFVFSCPPYFDLEKYSDSEDDLSNMDYPTFCNIYRSIITKAMSKLKQNRFAVFVVGDIRTKQGGYRNFVSETIDCFTKCIDSDGNQVQLYNEIILVNVAGSLPIRIGKQFGKYRKVGKMHQNVLVFYKGDMSKISIEFPEINIENCLDNQINNPNIALTEIE